MEILFESSLTEKPKVSFILLDWSCRESFHMLHYLNQQNVPRGNYEIIWIEYYNRRSPEIRKLLEGCESQSKPPPLDQWIVMDMPDTLYYHKHLMYNIGTVLSRGKIVTICDSDAMVRPTFVESIIKSFEEDSNIALHMDEVRNNDQRFYPFNYPSFDEVEAKGAINYKDGTTTGLIDTVDPLHTLNYGACLCARRDDLLAIGGSDEHLDYLGHICGPYELTFRLKNFGRREFWHPSELLYHVWHPGQAGNGNYVGPHDGMHMSSTALEAAKSGRIQPLLTNKAILALQEDPAQNPKNLISQLIDPSCFEKWTYQAMSESSSFYMWETAELVESLFHYNIVKHMGSFYGLPQALGAIDLNKKEERRHPEILKADSRENIRSLIEESFLGRTGNEYQARSSLSSWVFNQARRLRNNLKPDISSAGLAQTSMDSHRGYNLVKYEMKSYGIPFEFGEFDLTVQNLNDLPEEILMAPSPKALKSLIDQLKNMPEGQVIEEYQSYNIIKWGTLLYGVPNFYGPVDQTITKSPEGSLFPKASTVGHLKVLINQFIQSPEPCGESFQITIEDLNHRSVLSGSSLKILNGLIEDQTTMTLTPKLLEERQGFNIVKFKRQYWAIPQALGEIELTEDKSQKNPSILSADSLADAKSLIDEEKGVTVSPQLIDCMKHKIEGTMNETVRPVFFEELNGYNLAKYQNRFYGIPHTLMEDYLTRE